MGENFCFTVNGVERCTSEDKPLLRYLRDDLHLHSVKDGCSEGACGTCTIVVDGKAVKSCVHHYHGGIKRRGKGSLCVCLRGNGIRAVRILYAGHGDGRKGAD